MAGVLQKLSIDAEQFNTQHRTFENFGHALLPGGDGQIISQQKDKKIDFEAECGGFASKESKKARKEA
jgi:hypothetical protein